MLNREITKRDIFTANKHRLLFVIIISALVIDLFFYTGYYGSDDKSYILFVDELVHGTFPISTSGNGEFVHSSRETMDFGALRFAFTIPLSILYYLSGGVIFILILLPIALHLGIVIVTYKIGELLDGIPLGLFAALFTASSPLFFVYSGMVLPDNSEIFWFVISVLFLIKFQKQLPDIKKENRRNIYSKIFLSGLFLGLSYSSKFSAIIMLMPIGIYLVVIQSKIFSKTTFYSVAAFSAGFLIVPLIETIIIYALFGEFLSRYEIIAGMKEHYLRRASQQGVSLYERYWRMWRIFSRYYEPYQIYMLLGSLLLFPFVVRKHFILWTIVVWGILYKTFGTTNFSSYAPPVLQARYFAFSIPFIGLFAGLILQRIYNIIAKLVRSTGYLKLIYSILIIGFFFSMIYTVILKNIPNNGKLYRSTLVRSINNAYKNITEKDSTATIEMSDSCRYLMYAQYFLEDGRKDFSNFTMQHYSGNKSNHYFIGAVQFDLNESFVNGIAADTNSTYELVGIEHPGITTSDNILLRAKQFVSGINIPVGSENIYDPQRVFILKAEEMKDYKGQRNDIRNDLSNFLVLYQRSVFPDVAVYQNGKEISICWDKYFEERIIFINSFDDGLKRVPPGNNILGSLDSIAASYNFGFNILNESATYLETRINFYLYDETTMIKSLKDTLSFDPNQESEISVKLMNDADTKACKYRLQMFIINRANEEGKVIFKSFGIQNNY